MRILAIETSCDETAIAIVDATGDEQHAEFAVLGNALISQVDIHKEYGGVFPALAKREHAKNLVPLLEAALEEAELLREDTQAWSEELRAKIGETLAREADLANAFIAFVGECEVPAVDAIAVTAGPGLEPALWVGVNFAKALALAWQKPLIAVNHMEGHIFAALARETRDTQNSSVSTPQSGTRFNLVVADVQLPVLALLISGGHTELVLMNEWLRYELIGQTRDDAVGEAFDKVARMLGLPYPGGPEISRLAEEERRVRADRSRLADPVLAGSEGGEDQLAEALEPITLPRPMLHDATCDFSFSGLKTAVLTLLKNHPEMTAREKQHLAREFEDAAAEVLVKKTLRALDETGAATLALGGGVSANTHIRRVFKQAIETERPDVSLRIPAASLTTDNAIMIALAGYYHARGGDYADPATLAASGNRALA